MRLSWAHRLSIALQPHTNSKNHLRYARVIANPHINMVEPFNLNRVDSAYVSNDDHDLRLERELRLLPRICY